MKKIKTGGLTTQTLNCGSGGNESCRLNNTKDRNSSPTMGNTIPPLKARVSTNNPKKRGSKGSSDSSNTHSTYFGGWDKGTT